MFTQDRCPSRLVAIAAAVMAVAMPGYAAKTIYVSPTGSNISPYSSWIRAAHSIHAAASVSVSGDTIVVSNGVYAITNQITLPGGVSLTSQSGASSTKILGNGTSRCVNMPQTGAVLRGFTITGGVTTNNGGGVYCYGGTVSDCVITNNRAVGYAPNGGGAYCDNYSLISNCVVSGNSIDATYTDEMGKSFSFSWGGGIYAYWSDIDHCVVEGNTAHAGNDARGAGLFGNRRIDYCTIRGNTAYGHIFAEGGGVYSDVGGRLRNCLVADNYAHTDRGVSSGSIRAQGGGVYFFSGGGLQNCTISGNSVDGENSSAGGLNCGVDDQIFNTILCGNTATARLVAEYPDYDPNPTLPPHFYNCIAGGVASAAGFAAGSYRLAVNPPSPCLNAGTNLSWMTSAKDLDGYPRISQTTVDIGAYEVTIPAEVTVLSPVNVSTNGFTAQWRSATAATNYYLDVSTNMDFSSYLVDYSNRPIGALTQEAVAIGVWQEPYYYRVRAEGFYGLGPVSDLMTVVLRSAELSWLLLLL